MPIVIPVLGGGDGPYVTTTYVSYSSVTVENVSADDSLSSVDVLSRKTNESGYESLIVGNLTQRSGVGSIVVGSFHTDTYFAAIDVVNGDSFDILADILALPLSGPHLGAFGYYEINGKLLVNSTPVKIKKFVYQVPSGRLGAILNITLADPNPASVPAGAIIKFSLVVKVNGVTAEYVLLDNGKLQERAYTIAISGRGPQDEVTISSLDVISDKFGLAPRRPVTMFDPSRVRYDQVRTDYDQMIRDEHYAPILPVVEPVYGLTMKQVLERAYTGLGGSTFISALGSGFASSVVWGSLIGAVNQQGCGFDSVITNIADFRVRRVDFTLDGGWHDGAKPVIAMYGPQYFVQDNKLYILDAEKPLPAGITPRTVALNVHKSLTERLEYKPDANAVLLTYQYNANDPTEDAIRVSSERFTDEILDDSGLFPGDIGYYKTTRRRWDRVYFLPTNPDDILDTLPLHSDTETQQTITYYDTDGNPITLGTATTHQEVIDYEYDGDLKVKQKRIVTAAVADPQSSFHVSPIEVEREDTEISWTEDPNNSGVKIQDSVRTLLYQLVAYNPDDTENITSDLGDTDFVRMVPVLIAQSSGVLDSSWKFSGDLVPTKAIRETLKKGKGNQYDVEVIETDLLNNTHKTSYVAPTTGRVFNDPFEAKSRTILIRDLVSEEDIGPRIPVGVNAYELPRLRAIELGDRVLQRFKQPLMTLPMSLPGVDFAIARGSVIKGQKRSGYTGKYFVTGYSISGDNLGREGHRISQSLEAVEIVDA